MTYSATNDSASSSLETFFYNPTLAKEFSNNSRTPPLMDGETEEKRAKNVFINRTEAPQETPRLSLKGKETIIAKTPLPKESLEVPLETPRLSPKGRITILGKTPQYVSGINFSRVLNAYPVSEFSRLLGESKTPLKTNCPDQGEQKRPTFSDTVKAYNTRMNKEIIDRKKCLLNEETEGRNDINILEETNRTSLPQEFKNSLKIQGQINLLNEEMEGRSDILSLEETNRTSLREEFKNSLNSAKVSLSDRKMADNVLIASAALLVVGKFFL